ncbi:MAG: arsenate reductase (glutaredoxin) [Comamonas sp.]
MTQTLPPTDFPVTIYHNARCSNSRGALALIRERGITPRIVDYIAEPLDAAALTALVRQLGLPVRELLRSQEAAYAELQLADPALGETELIAAVAAHPVLLNRPIVVTPRGAALCRPPEKVLALLPG